MAPRDLPGDREADARALVIRAAVQSFEGGEDALRVLLVKADAVVLDRDRAPGAAGQCLSANANDRSDAIAMELEGVADQVLQQLTHLRPIGADDGKVADVDLGAKLLNARLEVADDHVSEIAKIDELELTVATTDAREREQVVDEPLHPLGRIRHPGHVRGRL